MGCIVSTEAAAEVGPALFFSLLIITLSFIPVFMLEGQEGRLFAPLAFTKTYAIASAAILSVSLVPVLLGWLIRGKILPEESHPVDRTRGAEGTRVSIQFDLGGRRCITKNRKCTSRYLLLDVQL